MIRASRRSFFGLMGTAPLAAKAAVDAELAKNANVLVSGLEMTESYSFGPTGNAEYGKSLVGAAEYVKTFGIPDVLEASLREQARNVRSLDPDVACKRSWSMSVKIATQRDRNYQRSVERIQMLSWQHRKFMTLKKLLGFDWPW